MVEALLLLLAVGVDVVVVVNDGVVLVANGTKMGSSYSFHSREG